MTYRDDARPTCPSCEIALEPMAIHRDVELAPSRILPPRPPVRYASWTRWSCTKCKRALFEQDDLAEILDGAAGDVQPLEKRWLVGDGAAGTCPCCPTVMMTIELYGQRVARCVQHGLWVEPGALVAMRDAATPQAKA